MKTISYNLLAYFIILQILINLHIYILVKIESLIFYSFFQVESFNVGSICHGDTDDEEDNTDSDVGLSSRGALRNRIDKLLVSENLYE